MKKDSMLHKCILILCQRYRKALKSFQQGALEADLNIKQGHSGITLDGPVYRAS